MPPRTSEEHPGFGVRLVPLLVIVGLSCANGGCFHNWHAADEHYFAAERGRVVEVVQISVHETSSPFNGWTDVLVEPCSSAGRGSDQSGDAQLPCWPGSFAAGFRPRLLGYLHDQMPSYRHTDVLLNAAQYLNREIGAFRGAWIVSTSPLAVAFFEDGPLEIPPRVERSIQRLDERMRSTTRPTTAPHNSISKTLRRTSFGIYELQAGDEVIAMDLRERYLQFVTERDQDARVDMVLLFPGNIHIASNGAPALLDSYPDMQTTVLHLREPMSLRSLMQSLTKPEELEREAKQVEKIPVSRFPPSTKPTSASP